MQRFERYTEDKFSDENLQMDMGPLENISKVMVLVLCILSDNA